MQIEHKKNTAYELAFPLVDKTDPSVFASGEAASITIDAYFNDAGTWSPLTLTPAPTIAEIGTTGVYEITLSADDMNHEQVLIKFSNANAGDTAFMFDMRGSVDCLDSQLGDYDHGGAAATLALSDYSNFQADVSAVTLADGPHGGAAATLTLTAASYDDFKADVSGLSTFNPALDRVTLADGVVHGGASASLVLSDYSAFQADVSGLSTFNPAVEQVTLADGVVHGGPAAEFQLKHITVQQTDANKSAVNLEGNGSFPGLEIAGGETGNGITISGGGTSGNGIDVSTTEGDGLSISAGGSGIGIDVDSVLGDAVTISSFGARGLLINSSGGGANGLEVRATSSGAAVSFLGGGVGLQINGSGANGVEVTGNTAIVASGVSGGSGLEINGGSTGNGVTIVGGGTSGNGINISTTDGDGIEIIPGGSIEHGVNIVTNAINGNGINIDVQGGGDSRGISITSASGNGIVVDAAGGTALQLFGGGLYTVSISGGTTAGLFVNAGSTGDGVLIDGGSTSGDALKLTSANGQNFNGDGSAAELDAFFSQTVPEITAAPSATDPMRLKLGWVHHLAQWPRLTDSNDGEDRVYNSANSIVIAEADVNDAAGQFARGAYGIPD